MLQPLSRPDRLELDHWVRKRQPVDVMETLASCTWKEPWLDFLGLRVSLGDLMLILRYFTMLSIRVSVCAVDIHEGHLSASLSSVDLLSSEQN